MMQSISPDHPLRLHFAGLVEQAFCEEVGLCDPLLTDYLAGLLVEFTHIDRLNTIRHARGKRLEQIAAMLLVFSDERPQTDAERDRTVYRQIADYTLFWAGVYPEQLKRACHDRADVLLDYVSKGKRSYAIVSKLADENEAPPPSLFRHLSEDFEFCLYGLGLVRRDWERLSAGSADAGGELVY